MQRSTKLRTSRLALISMPSAHHAPGWAMQRLATLSQARPQSLDSVPNASTMNVTIASQPQIRCPLGIIVLLPALRRTSRDDQGSLFVRRPPQELNQHTAGGAIRRLFLWCSGAGSEPPKRSWSSSVSLIRSMSVGWNLGLVLGRSAAAPPSVTARSRWR
jgi:hypothetical protein